MALLHLDGLEAISWSKSFPASVEGKEEEDDKDDAENAEDDYPHDKINSSVRTKLYKVLLSYFIGLTQHVAKSPPYGYILNLREERRKDGEEGGMPLSLIEARLYCIVGFLQAYIELEALESVLKPFINDVSRENFDLSYQHLKEWDVHAPEK